MTDQEEDFATMFEASVKARQFKRGEAVDGTIVAIGPKVALVNIGGKGGKGGGKPAAPQGWLARKLAELQAKAENVRREAERRGRARARARAGSNALFA